MKKIFLLLILLATGISNSFAAVKWSISSAAAPTGTASYCQGATTSGAYSDGYSVCTSALLGSGGAIVTYGWFLDGTVIPGSTGTFTLASAAAGSVSLPSGGITTLSSLSVGSHTLTVKYSNSDHGTLCGAGPFTSSSFTFTIVLSPTTVTAGGGGAFCDAATITASNGGSGTIYFQGTTSGGTSTATASSSQSVSSSGTYYFRAQSAGGCWGNEGSVTVSINPTPAAITGTPSLCQGATSTLSSATSGGAWTSSNTSVATVGTGAGLVTSVGAGTATITYSKAGCYVTKTVTVGAVPATVTTGGGGSFCNSTTITASLSGSGTIYFQGTTSGGTSTATASASQSVSASGTYYFRAQSAAGCWGNEGSVTITNLTPATISGNPLICIGIANAFTDATAGGTWSSDNTAIATVGSSGSVTGVTSGSTTITYTASGCFTTKTITVNSLPSPIGGTKEVCVASTTTLMDAGGGTWGSNNTSLATVDGSGIVSGVAAGIPVITYTLPNGCFRTSNVTVNPLPAAIGGSMTLCLGATTTFTDALPGGTWNSSNTSVANIGSASGAVTTASAGTTNISYTISATGCSVNSSLTVLPLPSTYTMIYGGDYCSGDAGVHVGLNGSDAGIIYQLYNGAIIVGSPVTGTGILIDFGLQTVAGSYGVIANPGTMCATTMAGLTTVVVDPLPTPYSVVGGGNYCTGGIGVHVHLSNSAIGVNYQLFADGIPSGGFVAGTGAPLDFGLKTRAGSYTVQATNTTTGCTNTMSGSATVNIDPLPTAYNVTGGGNLCVGGTGVHVGLNGSVSGTDYQLFLSGAPSGIPLHGTGSALDFGLLTTDGTYTVAAVNTTTSCTANMSGSAVVTVNPLPTVFSVTGGGNYCPGGTGVHIGLNGSTSGVNYQLYNGVAISGSSVPGNGGAIDFGLRTAAGTYTVVATSAATCTRSMALSATITINASPAVFSVTGGGSYCAGDVGLHVGLNGSVPGTSYQLFNGVTLAGAAFGTGSAIDFGLKTASGTYTVTASITATGCTGNMSGSTSITINPLPGLKTVSGGGNFCLGDTGVHVTLGGSTSGINYQLYHDFVAAGSSVSGTGSPIDFGRQTIPGSYSVIASNSGTGCYIGMTGSVPVGINPLPVLYGLTGAGSYCAGGTGVHIGLSSSNLGISYQLFKGVAADGIALPGTGAAIDFGLKTTAGSYTIVATNVTTTCHDTMSGTDVVSINSLPLVYNINGGGNYCPGGSGVPVGLSGSSTGVNYQLYRGGTPVGLPVAGTGTAVDYGSQTIAGSYSIVAADAVAGCTKNMTGSVTVSVNPAPTAYNVTGGGNYCSGGAGVHIGLDASATGSSYQLYNGLATAGSPVSGTGSAIDFGLQTSAGTYTVAAVNTYTCTLNMSGSALVATNPLPDVFSVTGGGNHCIGGAGVAVGLSNSATGFYYQLYNGAVPVGAPLSGTTGSPLSFGLVAIAANYSVLSTNEVTGCANTMSGIAVVTDRALPNVHNVTGGGNYCPGGTGVHIGLNASDAGVSYQLYNIGSPVGDPVSGTGGTLDFGLQTLTDAYTVVATDLSTTCTSSMSGSPVVGFNSLPVAYNVTGGGNYCSGGTGVHVGLNGSNTGVNYQLYNGVSTVGAAISGTGVLLDFGLQTASGGYTIVATDGSTTCTNNMTGSAVVGITPLPATYTVTGGGSYCFGSTGVNIGLDGSDAATYYQLYAGAVRVGAAMAGTGDMLDFGPQAGAGSYSVIATASSSACSNTMNGTVPVTITPLPAGYSVTGGGNYCDGGAGVAVGLSGSDAGNTYQLYNGTTAIGGPVTGTGGILDFGLQMMAGSYTVVANDPATTCSGNMPGMAAVIVNPLPVAYAMTGGGNYCTGGTGVHVMLSGSNAGISYQLYNGGAVGAPVTGVGGTIDFGLKTDAGTYSVIATNTTTSCANNMASSVTVGVAPLPATYAVVGAGTNYCAGGTGIDISLSGSASGINYQLFYGAVALGGPISGSGSMIDFGSKTGAGTYTVVGTDPSTACSSNMTGAATITINALPTAYAVAGGGGYCIGGTGVHVQLGGSNTGISYQLYNGATLVGAPISGTAFPLDFGLQTSAGSYTVIATNMFTSCTNIMSGSAPVIVNELPATYTVTGGGNYCAGGAGVHIGLSGSSSGVAYKLFRGATLVGAPVTGTGAAVDFGFNTVAGLYTVVAVNTATTCTSNMAGSASVGTTPLPSVYSVIGGGGYCQGGTGVHVGLGGSGIGITYQLYKGASLIGSALTGAGGPLDFGLQTVAGSYTVVASNSITGCNVNMSGSATVAVNPLPVAYGVIGGGSFCAGGSGVHVGLNSSATGINYQLYNGIVPAGGFIAGTGTPVDFGVQTDSGTYTVVATNAVTSCTNTMLSAATVHINPVVVPAVSLTTGVGDVLCAGNLVTITALTVNGGALPTYEWRKNGLLAPATGSSYNFLPTNGDNVTVKITSNAICATPSVATASLPLTVNDRAVPTITVSADLGNVVCAGTTVNYSAVTTYGGSAPVFTWTKNGVNVSNSPAYSYVPANNDVVNCVLTSNYQCRVTTTVSGDDIKMEVASSTPPVVTITSTTGTTISKGQSITLNAAVTNGGPTPAYQWLINGIEVFGANYASYTGSNFSDQDNVSCQVTSSGGCAGLQGTGSVTINISSVGVKQTQAEALDLQLVPNPNKGVFTIKGALGTTGNEVVLLEITDMLGQVVYKSNLTTHAGNVNEKIQLNDNIPNGMYLANFRSLSGNKVFHIVVEK